jgi:hypothetical protein
MLALRGKVEDAVYRRGLFVGELYHGPVSTSTGFLHPWNYFVSEN